MHGYDLRRELAGVLGPEWAVNYGQIYSTLERMVRDGLVVQSETLSGSDAPDRKLYTVTPAGRTELRQWFMSPVKGPDTGRDELYAKVLLALTGDVSIDEVIQVQRKGQLRRIGLLTELKERLDPELDLAQVLQADLSIAKTEAAINWLNATEAKIRASKGASPQGVAGSAVPRTTPDVAGASEVEARSHERGKR